MGVRHVGATGTAFLVALLLTACGPDEPAGETPAAATASPDAASPGTGTGTPETNTPGETTTPTDPATPPVAEPGVLATDLTSPWDVEFLPDGDALVTERDTARVLRVSPDGDITEVGTVPDVRHGGEGGLLGLAIDPVDASSVYVYATTAEDNRVLRMRLDGDSLTGDGVVLEGIPSNPTRHNGGRIAFGPDGYLYVATGDAGRAELAQDPNSLAGKILRVERDGDPAPGNPTDGSPVWTLGHRNVQGLGWVPSGPAAGSMFASEFGQDRWDELNRIEPGQNYGWPEVEGIAGATERDGFTDPLHVWRPAEASPSGVAVTANHVYLATLRGESLWQVPLDGDEIGEPRRLLEGEHGRLRAVEVDATGQLWILTSNIAWGEPVQPVDRIVVVDPADL
ncbi:PQQ-dependent sugar dehydrogenase [Georgenia halophila]|uniref:PQQ-dependent sugar dehydrogenase n=1 Tax=Georgenia halophila TaxID=620889 RepID=A0ABP8LE71_9MICO